ncbi:MAG: SH3 domain-containing protein [Symploca sp. SIO3C6]|nr:SH3 domain-containing protein [Symploca sp. SIO3C6]
MGILLGFLKFILGVSLAIAILGASGFYGARYLMTRLTAPPERPVFPEETATPISDGPDSSADARDASGEVGAGGAQPDANVNENIDATPIVDAPSPLEPGAYKARVVQPIGLIMRQGPDVSTTQLGGIAYNEEVIVLSESTDQRWIKIRLPGSDVEGWVKNGNTEPID